MNPTQFLMVSKLLASKILAHKLAPRKDTLKAWTHPEYHLQIVPSSKSQPLSDSLGRSGRPSVGIVTVSLGSVACSRSVLPQVLIGPPQKAAHERQIWHMLPLTILAQLKIESTACVELANLSKAGKAVQHVLQDIDDRAARESGLAQGLSAGWLVTHSCTGW